MVLALLKPMNTAAPSAPNKVVSKLGLRAKLTQALAFFGQPGHAGKRHGFAWLGAAAALALSLSVAHASEGLHPSVVTAPAAVKAAWPKTFTVYTQSPDTHGYSIGAASLIMKLKTPNGYDLFFLTADHVVEPKCLTGATCPQTFLIQDFRGKFANGALAPEPLTGLHFDQVQVVKRFRNPDLAVLHAHARLTVSVPEPVRLPNRCDLKRLDAVYAIGTPAVQDRTAKDRKPIVDPDINQKRWSEGVYIDRAVETRGLERRLEFATSLDVLRGNSGGPILDREGQQVGVVIVAADTHAKGFAYAGSDRPEKLQWHSLSPQCEYLQALRQDLEMALDKLLRAQKMVTAGGVTVQRPNG